MCEPKISRTWTLWAYDYGDHKDFPSHLFMHIGTKGYVKLHGIEKPIVKVQITEDINGAYFGWLDTGADAPSMIWPSQIQFNMCFPYGPEIEEKRGKGKSLRLAITPLDT